MKAGLVGRATADHLAKLAGQVPADQAIVEIGVFMARTTVFLASGARSGNGAHVYGVDPWDLPGERYPYKWLNHPRKGRIRQLFTKPQTRHLAEQTVANSGLKDQITLIRGFSVEVAASWGWPEIGLLFIDGDHREEHVRADWEAWRSHLTPKAIVAFDDYHKDYPGVTKVVDELVAAGAIKIIKTIARGNSALVLTRVDS